MIINYLKLIVTIANVGSYSEAAKNLYVSQPYLTKIVKTVEKTYDVKIFKRNKTGVELTQDGKEFVAKANDLLKNVDALKDIKKNKNIIDLTISSFPSSYPMEAYVDFYKKLENNKTLSRCHYYEKNTLEVIEDVCFHYCDIGIISIKNIFLKQNTKYFSDKRIIYKKIFVLEPNIICKPNHPLLKKDKIDLLDLYHYNLVAFSNMQKEHSSIFDEGYYNQNNLSHVIDFDKFSHITYVNNRATLYGLLLHSNKIAIGNYIPTINHEVFNLTFLPLKNIVKDIVLDELSNSLYCIYPENKPLSHYAKMYLSILKNIYKKHLNID